MDVLTITLGLLVLAVTVLFWHLTKHHGSLEKLGIPLLKPIAFLGSPPFALHKVLFHKWQQEQHKKLGKTFGRYDGVTPVISTIDPELVKSILVKNFDCFTDTLDIYIKDEGLTLDISKGETWKALRKNLSPTFSSGKLKGMMEPMSGVADRMMEHIDSLVTKNPVVDVKDVFQGLALNVICSCAFGVDANAHKNTDTDLVKHGKAAFSNFRINTWTDSLVVNLISHFPGMERLLPILPKEWFLIGEISRDIMRQREAANIHGKDFLARLIELRNAKKKTPDSDDLKHLNEDIISAQGIIFFLAGYETTANTLSTTCYALAKHQQIQNIVYDEIQRVIADHNGKIDENTISDMTYLDAVISEDLRLQGPITLQVRTCVKDCEAAPGMLIKKGTRIDIPTYASHLNPEFFPDPDEFRPERFLKENMDQIIPFTYRPFGGGPRQCIGQRFSQIEMKIALAKLLSKYKLATAPETKLDVRPGDQFFISYPDMKVKLEKRA